MQDYAWKGANKHPQQCFFTDLEWINSGICGRDLDLKSIPLIMFTSRRCVFFKKAVQFKQMAPLSYSIIWTAAVHRGDFKTRGQAHPEIRLLF